MAPATTLPEYRSHKTVRAGRILHIQDTKFGADLILEEGVSVPVDRFWLDRHHPSEGGYFVRYRDGYTSYSPAAAFEDGYTRL